MNIEPVTQPVRCAPECLQSYCPCLAQKIDDLVFAIFQLCHRFCPDTSRNLFPIFYITVPSSTTSSQTSSEPTPPQTPPPEPLPTDSIDNATRLALNVLRTYTPPGPLSFQFSEPKEIKQAKATVATADPMKVLLLLTRYGFGNKKWNQLQIQLHTKTGQSLDQDARDLSAILHPEASLTDPTTTLISTYLKTHRIADLILYLKTERAKLNLSDSDIPEKIDVLHTS